MVFHRLTDKSITADIECEQFPELHGNVMIKISVYHAGRKERRLLGTPNDTVELLPRITIVITVKINNIQLSVPADHHITDVVVAMLISLRSAFE